MSLNRYAKKIDTAQPAIVDGLRKAGIEVWVISKPVDLLTRYKQRHWLPLEVKSDTSAARTRKDQEKQKEMLAATGIPVVKSLQEALEAVTKHGARYAST